MTTLKKVILTGVVLLVGITLAFWWSQRPQRITQEFAGHLSHERYEEAAKMLRAPCTMELADDGSLSLVDHTGALTTVPAKRLPFRVGGGKDDKASDFSMTALQGSTKGILDTPAVIVYLSIDGGKVRIESVES